MSGGSLPSQPTTKKFASLLWQVPLCLVWPLYLATKWQKDNWALGLCFVLGGVLAIFSFEIEGAIAIFFFILCIAAVFISIHVLLIKVGLYLIGKNIAFKKLIVMAMTPFIVSTFIFTYAVKAVDGGYGVLPSFGVALTILVLALANIILIFLSMQMALRASYKKTLVVTGLASLFCFYLISQSYPFVATHIDLLSMPHTYRAAYYHLIQKPYLRSRYCTLDNTEWCDNYIRTAFRENDE